MEHVVAHVVGPEHAGAASDERRALPPKNRCKRRRTGEDDRHGTGESLARRPGKDELAEAGLTGVPDITISAVPLSLVYKREFPLFERTGNYPATRMSETRNNKTIQRTVGSWASPISEPGLYTASCGGGCSVSIIDVYKGDNACKQCLGWKRVDDGEKQSWKYWEELPVSIRLAVTLGLVRPVECPNCHGTGQEPRDE